jgi:hypothetical protein
MRCGDLQRPIYRAASVHRAACSAGRALRVDHPHAYAHLPALRTWCKAASAREGGAHASRRRGRARWPGGPGRLAANGRPAGAGGRGGSTVTQRPARGTCSAARSASASDQASAAAALPAPGLAAALAGPGRQPRRPPATRRSGWAARDGGRQAALGGGVGGWGEEGVGGRRGREAIARAGRAAAGVGGWGAGDGSPGGRWWRASAEQARRRECRIQLRAP